MNIDEIKRNLNAGRNRNLEPPTGNQQPTIPFISVPREQKKRSEPEIPRVANRVFDPQNEEEEIVPNSKSWEVPKGKEDLEIDPLSSVSGFVRMLDLDNPEDDWRIRTSKGRRSHKNFTHFLVDAI